LPSGKYNLNRERREKMKAFIVTCINLAWKPVIASVHAPSLEEATEKVVKEYEGERIEPDLVKATTPRKRLYGGGMEAILKLEEVHLVE
jgi:hypothetical protein